MFGVIFDALAAIYCSPHRSSEVSEEVTGEVEEEVAEGESAELARTLTVVHVYARTALAAYFERKADHSRKFYPLILEYPEPHPLLLAARKGETERVRILLEVGASVDYKDEFRNTPLHDAAKYGHIAVARQLLQYGANIEAMNSFRRTPLWLAIQEGREGMVTYLEEQGAVTPDILNPPN